MFLHFYKFQFQDLSNNFLSAPSAKLLLLAGVDRLDTNLTVAQMQVSLVIYTTSFPPLLKIIFPEIIDT